MPDKAGRKISGQLINIWATATAAVVAVAALILSLISTVQLNSNPSVTLWLPNSIRLSAVSLPKFRTTISHDIYIQPSLTVDRFSNENPTVTQYALEIIPQSEGGRPLQAFPVSFSSFPADNSMLGERITHESDIVPVAVTPAGPATPAIQFTIFDDLFPRGKSILRLTLTEASGEVVTKDACLDLSPGGSDMVNTDTHRVYFRLFVGYTGETGAADRETLDPHCYSL